MMLSAQSTIFHSAITGGKEGVEAIPRDKAVYRSCIDKKKDGDIKKFEKERQRRIRNLERCNREIYARRMRIMK